MDIDDLVEKGLAEHGCQDAHIPSQTDEVDFPLLHDFDDFAVIVLAGRKIFGSEVEGVKIPLPGNFQTPGFFFVAEDQIDIGVDLAGENRVMNGHEIGSSP